MKILLAVDGSVYSDAAASELAANFGDAGNQIKIVNVIRLPFVPTAETRSLPNSEYSQIEREMRQNAEAALSSAVAHFQSGNNTAITTEILTGEAAEVILEEAERWHADLIAVGSHGYRGWKRFLLGSVSRQVAQNAACSVMILRPRQMQFAAAT